MDWKSLVSRVLHRSETPSVVVDARKRVRLVNRAMERALGWREHEVLDRPFARAYAAERARKAISHGMETCLRGGARHVEVVLRSREGRAYDALLEMTLVGLPREPALLIEANLRGPSREVPSIPGVEVYEVERGPAGFGRVRYRWPNVGSEGGRCYMIRYGIDRPCSACPIEHIGPERPRCTSILNVADHQYDMVTAERIDEATVRVGVHRIDDETVSRLVHARVKRMSERAGLSEREQMVLTYLLMGRTLRNIGEILGISPRTVKFHQVNVLNKLGADSRVDLMRLLL